MVHVSWYEGVQSRAEKDTHQKQHNHKRNLMVGDESNFAVGLLATQSCMPALGSGAMPNLTFGAAPSPSGASSSTSGLHAFGGSVPALGAGSSFPSLGFGAPSGAPMLGGCAIPQQHNLYQMQQQQQPHQQQPPATTDIFLNGLPKQVKDTLERVAMGAESAIKAGENTLRKFDKVKMVNARLEDTPWPIMDVVT